MKFAIAGAGAMGCRFGYQLHKAGYEVVLIDTWATHIDTIREHGLEVDYNGQLETIHIPIYYPHEVQEEVDVVILLTKAMQLDSMLSAIQHILRPHTKAVCLLNGIGHEEVIQKYVSLDNIIMGTTIWTAQLNGPGKAFLHGIGNLALQNFVEGNEAKATTEEVVAVLTQAGLNAQYGNDVKTAIWRKACVNGCCNATSAILECNVNGVMNNHYSYPFVTSIVEEFAKTAATQGVSLDVEEVTEFVISASLKVGEHFPSMYQDLIANNRATEVDYINGAVSRIGKMHHIPTPICDTIVYLTHMKELLLGAK